MKILIVFLLLAGCSSGMVCEELHYEKDGQPYKRVTCEY